MNSLEITNINIIYVNDLSVPSLKADIKIEFNNQLYLKDITIREQNRQLYLSFPHSCFPITKEFLAYMEVKIFAKYHLEKE